MQTLFLRESINIQIQCYIRVLTGQRLQSTVAWKPTPSSATWTFPQERLPALCLALSEGWM